MSTEFNKYLIYVSLLLFRIVVNLVNYVKTYVVVKNNFISGSDFKKGEAIQTNFQPCCGIITDGDNK